MGLKLKWLMQEMMTDHNLEHPYKVSLDIRIKDQTMMNMKDQNKAKNLKDPLLATTKNLSRDKRQFTEDQPKVMKP